MARSDRGPGLRHHAAMSAADAPFWNELARSLAARGVPGPLGTPRALGGGCIHDASRVWAGDRILFVKRNGPECADMFAAEAEGLEELSAAAGEGLRIPRPIAHGEAAGQAYLVTEHVAMDGRGGDAAAFGRGLAQLHAHGAECFGWGRDNYIGTTPQPNGWYTDWAGFWRERRLGHQLALARADGNGRLADRCERLVERLGALLRGHAPRPSVLHGDLWAGNYGYDDDRGAAVLFDPATYHGDRECDLAMTELFGGFPAAFHQAYTAEWPLDEGYPVRRDLYNLYHVLNHAHLFGGGYIRQASSMIERLLAAAG